MGYKLKKNWEEIKEFKLNEYKKRLLKNYSI